MNYSDARKVSEGPAASWAAGVAPSSFPVSNDKEVREIIDGGGDVESSSPSSSSSEVPKGKETLRRTMHEQRDSLTESEFNFLTTLLDEGEQQKIATAAMNLLDKDLFFEQKKAISPRSVMTNETLWSESFVAKQREDLFLKHPVALTRAQSMQKRRTFLDKRRNDSTYNDLWKAHEGGLGISANASSKSAIAKLHRRQTSSSSILSKTSSSFHNLVAMDIDSKSLSASVKSKLIAGPDGRGTSLPFPKVPATLRQHMSENNVNVPLVKKSSNDDEIEASFKALLPLPPQSPALTTNTNNEKRGNNAPPFALKRSRSIQHLDSSNKLNNAASRPSVVRRQSSLGRASNVSLQNSIWTNASSSLPAIPKPLADRPKHVKRQESFGKPPTSGQASVVNNICNIRSTNASNSSNVKPPVVKERISSTRVSFNGEEFELILLRSSSSTSNLVEPGAVSLPKPEPMARRSTSTDVLINGGELFNDETAESQTNDGEDRQMKHSQFLKQSLEESDISILKKRQRNLSDGEMMALLSIENDFCIELERMASYRKNLNQEADEEESKESLLLNSDHNDERLPIRTRHPSFRRSLLWEDLQSHYVDEEDAVFPFLILGTSVHDVEAKPHVLSPPLIESLQTFLPFSVSENNFWLRFSMVRDGASLDTLLRAVRGARSTLLAIETVDGEVFGSFQSVPWSRRRGYFGNGQSFLWRMRHSRSSSSSLGSASVVDRAQLESTVDVYPWAGKNDMTQYCTRELIAIGGGDDDDSLCDDREEEKRRNDCGFGLALDADLLRGTSSRCRTFLSPPLTSLSPDGGFDVANVEVWTLTPCITLKEAETMELSQLFLQEHTVMLQ